VAFRLLDHAGDRGQCPLQRLGRDRPLVLEVLAEAGHLCAIDDGAPPPGRVALGDVELDRVRPDVDHRIAAGSGADERRQPQRVAGVHGPVEADAADGGDDCRGILGLDRDRSRAVPLRLHVGALGHAAAEGIANPPLVDPERPQRAGRLDQLGE
jgi:hypothetical protein